MGYLGEYDLTKDFPDYSGGGQEKGHHNNDKSYGLGTDYNEGFEELKDGAKTGLELPSLSRSQTGYGRYLETINTSAEWAVALGLKGAFGNFAKKLEIEYGSNGINLNGINSQSLAGTPEFSGSIYGSIGKPGKTGTECAYVLELDILGFNVELQQDKITVSRELGADVGFAVNGGIECEHSIRIGIDSPSGLHDKEWEFKPVPDSIPLPTHK